MIQGQSLSSSSQDAGTSSGSESESGNTDLGDGQEAVVISNGTDNHNGALILLAKVRNDTGDRDGRSVNAGHEKSAEDDLVEGRLSSAGQEAVKLHEQLEVCELSWLESLSLGDKSWYKKLSSLVASSSPCSPSSNSMYRSR